MLYSLNHLEYSTNGKVAPAGFIFQLLPAFDMTHFLDDRTQEMVERTVLKLTVLKHSLGV